MRIRIVEKAFEVEATPHLNGTDMEFIVGNTDYRTMNKVEFAQRFRNADGSLIDNGQISPLDPPFYAVYSSRKEMEASYNILANRWKLFSEGKVDENISPLEFYIRFQVIRPEEIPVELSSITTKDMFRLKFHYRDKKTVYYVEMTNHKATWLVTLKDYHQHLGLKYTTVGELIDGMRKIVEPLELDEIALELTYRNKVYVL